MAEPATAPAPDPAVTTTPEPSTDPTPPGADGNFDYLDTPDSTMPTDPMEFRDDIEEREAEEPDKAEDKTEDISAPDASVDTKDKTEDTAEPKAEPEPELKADPQIAEQARAFAEFDQALQNDPAEVAGAILDSMDARQRAAFLAQYGVTGEAQRPAFDAEGYEPQNELETAIKDRWSDVDSIPQIISETRRLDQGLLEAHENLQQVQQAFVPHIAEANVQAQVALAKIDALCEILGVALDSPDEKAVVEALNGGKATYADAVRKAANYTKAVETAKQREAPRPKTPGNEKRTPEPIPEGTSMEEISRRLGFLPRR